QLLLNAHHGEFDSLNTDDLTQRIGIAREERGADGFADHRDIRPRAILLIREKAAADNSDIADGGHGGAHAHNGAILASHVLTLHIAKIVAGGAVQDVFAVDGFHKARILRAD